MIPEDSLLYEYSVLRYVPRVDREEFINIGLLLMCKRRKWLRGEIALLPQRLQAFDPRVNIDALRRQLQFFSRNDVPGKDLPVEERYRWLASVKSAVIQTSPSHPGFIKTKEKDPDYEALLNEEFDRLFEELVL